MWAFISISTTNLCRNKLHQKSQLLKPDPAVISCYHHPKWMLLHVTLKRKECFIFLKTDFLVSSFVFWFPRCKGRTHGCNLSEMRCTHGSRVSCAIADFQTIHFKWLIRCKFLPLPLFAPSRLELTIVWKYLTQVCLCATSHNDFPRDKLKTL